MLASAVILAIWGHPLGSTLLLLVVGALGTVVFSAVHHAEVVALRVGEPFGTLVLALAVLTLVLPTFTTTTAGPTFSPAQLMFAGTMSLLPYAVFLFVQTARHRDHFLPVSRSNTSHRLPSK